jgi:predicted Zn-dependent protease
MNTAVRVILLTLFFLFLENQPRAETDHPEPSPSFSVDEVSYVEAKLLLDAKNWNEAVSAYRVLLKREPKSIRVRVELATALIYVKQRDEALSLLNELARSTKGVERSFLIRRIRILSRVFATNESFKSFQDGLNLLNNKKYRNAQDKFEKTLKDEPANVEVLIRLGQSLLLGGNLEDAVRQLKLAKQFNPFQPEVRLWLGRGLSQLNQSHEAIAELTIAHHELKGMELSTLWLADALTSIGQVNSAIRLLDADVKQWPLHLSSLIQVAKFKSQLVHPDSQVLWSARKDLQLAMSRLEEYDSKNQYARSGELDIDLSRSPAELKPEIQRLQQQVENRLNQISNQR